MVKRDLVPVEDLDSAEQELIITFLQQHEDFELQPGEEIHYNMGERKVEIWTTTIKKPNRRKVDWDLVAP